MCYFWPCASTADTIEAILNHTLRLHCNQGNQGFTVRKKILDENSGLTVYKSLHFNVLICEIQNRLKDGQKVCINEDSLTISFKRILPSESSKISNEMQDKSVLTDDANIYQLIPHVIDVLKDIGRISDFISVLQAIKNGYLNDNIAFHLLLDIGDFYYLN